MHFVKETKHVICFKYNVFMTSADEKNFFRLVTFLLAIRIGLR